MKNLYLIISSFIYISSLAQNPISASDLDGVTVLSNPLVNFAGTQQIRTLNASSFLDNVEDKIIIDNSPFLFKEWKNGSITLKSGTIYNGKFAYDTFNDEMLYKDEEQQKIISLFKNIIKQIKIDSLIFTPEHTNDGYKFLVELTKNNGKIKLYKNFEASITKSMYNPVIHSKKPLDKFKINETYYIKHNDQFSPKLKLKSKEIKTYLNKIEEFKKIKSFINNNSIKDEIDLLELVKKTEYLIKEMN